MRSRAFARVVLLCVFAAGCANKPKPIAEATGSVTLDGLPVEAGIVSFIPMDDGKISGGAAISAGRYKLYPGSGIEPGNYRVEIRWAKPTGEKVKEPVYGHSPDIFAEAIPAKYNSESVLTVELTKGTNALDFSLEK
jgi:hypothetical protein